MAVTYVQSANNGENPDADAAVACTLPGSVSIGNLIVVAGRYGVGGRTMSVTDSLTHTYTPINEIEISTGAIEMGLFYTVVTSTGTCSVTFSHSGATIAARMGIIAYELTGQDASQPHSSNSGAFSSAASTSFSCGSITTTNPGVIIAAVAFTGATTNPSVDADYTANAIIDNTGNIMAGLRFTGAITETPTHTSSVAAAHVGLAAAFDEAGGATPTMRRRARMLMGVGA